MVIASPHRVRPLVSALALASAAACLFATLTVHAQDRENNPVAPTEAAPLLSDHRWREGSFGLSLRPPTGTRVVQQAGDDALVAFTNPQLYTIRVDIRRGEKAVNLNTLKQQTMIDVTYGSELAVVIDDQAIRPAGRPGALTYFRVRNDDRDSVFGQALMKIDPSTIALFQLDGPLATFESSRRVFEAVLDSVQLASPAELDRIRNAWIQAAQRWHQGVSREALKAAMIPEQWFRILQGKEDIGYLRIRHSLDSMLGLPGIRVEINSRIIVGRSSYDTESFCWESDDGTQEVWSLRTAQRTLKPESNLPAAAAATRPHITQETGLRSGPRITVTREQPGHVDHLQWATPPTGYISQVELHLLPTLFPRDRQHDFGFYAYLSSIGELTLRTMQIFALPDGGYIVRDRPSPEQAEQIATYDANGRLVSRQLGNGRVMLRATPEQMKRIWGIQ